MAQVLSPSQTGWRDACCCRIAERVAAQPLWFGWELRASCQSKALRLEFASAINWGAWVCWPSGNTQALSIYSVFSWVSCQVLFWEVLSLQSGMLSTIKNVQALIAHEAKLYVLRRPDYFSMPIKWLTLYINPSRSGLFGNFPSHQLLPVVCLGILPRTKNRGGCSAGFFFVGGGSAICPSLYMTINAYSDCVAVMECSVHRGEGEVKV